MKKIVSLFAVLALMLCPLCGCAQSGSTEKIQIIATLFPQYDFARQIGGDRVEVTMLLPAGSESHSFEPSPKDMVNIQSADLFIYTGAEMEPWAGRVLDGLGGDGPMVLDGSQGIELMESESGEGSGDGHQHGLDPHFWLDMSLAQQFVNAIRDALIALDPEGEALYTQNAQDYCRALQDLDGAFMEAAQNGQRKELIFGGRFAFGYFVRRYGLTYRAAYDSCAAGAEPSVKVVAALIQEIQDKDIPVIYYEELADPKVARSIAEQTGVEMRLLSSAHNVTKEQMEAGVSFLDIMNDNLEAIREGLNG